MAIFPSTSVSSALQGRIWTTQREGFASISIERSSQLFLYPVLIWAFFSQGYQGNWWKPIYLMSILQQLLGIASKILLRNIAKSFFFYVFRSELNYKISSNLDDFFIFGSIASSLDMYPTVLLKFQWVTGISLISMKADHNWDGIWLLKVLRLDLSGSVCSKWIPV